MNLPPLDQQTKVTSLGAEHARQLADLHLHIWKKAYAPIFGEEAVQSLSQEEFLSIWEQRLQQGLYQCLGLWQGERLIGFAGWGAVDAARAEIYHFYLHPQHWGALHAAHFMHNLLQILEKKGYAQVLLWVLKENKRAQRFYQKQGFGLTQKEQERHRYGLLLQEVQMMRGL